MDAFLRRPEARRRFSNAGYRVFDGPPVRVSEQVAQERTKWSNIIVGLKIDKVI